MYIGAISEFNQNEDFTLYEERFEQFCLANKIESEKSKTALLLSQVSQDVYNKTLRDLTFPVLPKDKKYEELTVELKTHFSPQVNVYRERIKFYHAFQATDETTTEWHARLRSLAVNCNFSSLEEILKDRFISGMKSGPVLDRIVEEPTSQSLARLMEIAATKELSMTYNDGERINAIGPTRNTQIQETSVPKQTGRHSGDGRAGEPTFMHPRQGTNQTRAWKPAYGRRMENGNASNGGVTCKCCGKKHGGIWRYKEYQCNNCGKIGHLQSVCREVMFRTYVYGCER